MENDIAKLSPLFKERNEINQKIWLLYETFDGDTTQLKEKLVGKCVYFPLTNVYLLNVTDVVYIRETKRFEIRAESGYDLWDDENLSYWRCFIRRAYREDISLHVLDPYDNDCYDRYEVLDEETATNKILSITKESSLSELDKKISENDNNYKYAEFDYDEE